MNADFTPVAAAIADLEGSEKTLENLSSSNDTAQAALVNATSTASSAATALTAGQTDVLAKAKALETALTTFEAAVTGPTT